MVCIAVCRQVSSVELQQFLDNFGSVVVVDMFAAALRNGNNIASASNICDPSSLFPDRLWFVAPLVASLVGIECMQTRVQREAWRLLDTALPPATPIAKMKEKE